MSKLIDLWLEQTDDEKLEFKKIMKDQLNEIEFCRTHRVVGDSDAGTSFLVPIMTFEFPAGDTADGGFMQTCCTRVGTDGDCLSSELCPYCDNPPKRFLKGYDCYD